MTFWVRDLLRIRWKSWFLSQVGGRRGVWNQTILCVISKGSQIPWGLPKFIHPSIHSVVSECLLCAGHHAKCWDTVMGPINMASTLWDLEASVTHSGWEVLSWRFSQPWFSGLSRLLVSHRVREAELATDFCKRLRKVPYEFPPYYEYGPVDWILHQIRRTLSFTNFWTSGMCRILLSR